MKTNNLGNVGVSTPTLKRSRFPWSKNAYTTCGFGEVQPLKCQLCDADSENTISIENLTYLADLVSPTYGKVDVNFWHYFVNMRDMIPDFDSFLAKNPVEQSQGVGLQEFLEMPTITHAELSLLCLIGAHCTAYKVTQDFNENRSVQLPIWKLNDTASQTAIAGEFSGLQTAAQVATQNFCAVTTGFAAAIPSSPIASPLCGTSMGMAIDIRCLMPSSLNESLRLLNGSNAAYCYLPLSNPDWQSFFEVQDANGVTVLKQEGRDIAPVSLQEGGYDFLIEMSSGYGSDRYIFAFRMHAFGRRLHKALTGVGFTPDFTNTERVSMLPLYAVYMAYFNCFGILLYDNFDQSGLGRLLRVFNNTVGQGALHLEWLWVYGTPPSIGDCPFVADAGSTFIRDLGSMWFTDSQDYVSMQTYSPTVAQNWDSNFIRNIAAPLAGQSQSNITVPSDNTPADGTTDNAHAYIDSIVHGQVDTELIQKLYLQTNGSTIAGKRLKDVLMILGFGKWLEHQKPRFIGHDVIEIDFNQVISTANTEDNGKGSSVGARGGRGQGYGKTKTHKYHNDEMGFLVTFVSVVPHSGYSQGLNPAFEAVSRDDFYNPLWDGLGVEATKIKDIFGDRPVALLDNQGSHRANETEGTFGFAPNQSKWKKEFNTYSGGFARKSKQDYFLTFCLDRFVDVGATALTYQDDTPQVESNGLIHRDSNIIQVFPPEQLALAGIHYRYPTRYPWLGNFNRIFANTGDSSESYYGVINNWDNLMSNWEYFNNEDDGFIVMSVFNQWNNMRKKPISDSFETFDEDNPIKTNIAKA